MTFFAKSKAQLTVGLEQQKHLIGESLFQGDTLQPFTFKTGQWPISRAHSLACFATEAQEEIQGKEKPQ